MLSKIPKNTTLRVTLLITALAITYFGMFGFLRKFTPLPDRDLLIFFGIYTAGVLMTAYVNVHRWATWAAMPPPEERFPHERYAMARHMLDLLSDRAGFPIELRVVESKRIYVFAAGMSHKLVLISDAALVKLSPLALQGVLGHEVAHMTINHAPRNAVVLSAFFGFRIAMKFPTGMNFYLVLLLLMYFRNNEYEADRVGTVLVGHDAMLKALDEVQFLTRMPNFGHLFEFLLSTHPSYERRRARLAKLTHTNGVVEFPNYHAETVTR